MTNIAEILKDAPKGTKLYSPICGECELQEVKINDTYPIKVYFRIEEGYDTQIFNTHGQSFASGECVLFPSKDNRDWSTFKVEKPKYMPKPFEMILYRMSDEDNWLNDFFQFFDDNNYFCIGGYGPQCIPYHGNEHLMGTTNNPE